MHELYDMGVTLDVRIINAIEVHEEERKESWAEDGAQETLVFADRLADILFKAAIDLKIPPPADEFWDAAKELFNNEFARNTCLEHLQSRIAMMYCTHTDEMAERALQLTEELLDVFPTTEVNDALLRLSRNYILGLFPECSLLCGLILENALQDAFHLHGRKLPAVPPGKGRFQTWLSTAKKNGWITADQAEAARSIWKERNRAAHEPTDTGPDVLEKIQALVPLLTSLYAVE
ncbi:hypothetical protein ACFL6R_02875 [Gemmatimonadota bacterium]